MLLIKVLVADQIMTEQVLLRTLAPEMVCCEGEVLRR